MTQLFSIKNIEKHIVFCILFAISTGVLANDSIPKSDFLEYCKKSDAYLKFSYTDITYRKVWGSYRKYVTVNNKLVVNNRAGVDKFAYLNLSEYVSNNIYEIDVKTLKSDGSVVELDSSKVFQIKTNNKKFGPINYPIPGVEPGDTIETNFTYTKYTKTHQMMDFVNLYSSVPSLNTEYSIKSNPELDIRYKRYNNFPKPQVVSNDTLLYCVFKMEKIKGLEENENTCIPCELPYLYYSMEKKDSELISWKDIYNQEFNFITQPISLDNKNASFYNRWKKGLINQAKDSSKYYKFKLLHNDIMTNMRMELAEEDELLKSSGYFLKEKRFNPQSIRRLFRQILEDLEINYWAVFARSKRAGKIDPHYIRKGEYDHIFFAYTDDKGIMNLLYPHEAFYKYHINEIPTSLYNTDALIVRPYFTEKIKKKDKFIGYDLELAQTDSVTVNMVKLPAANSSHNYVKQVFYSSVEMQEEKIPLKYRFSVSGGLYTELKSFFELLSQDKDASDFYDALNEFEGDENLIEIDTITSASFKEVKPFRYTMNAEGSLNGIVSFLNNKMAIISLDKLLQHNTIESNETASKLNYYLDYSYSDDIIAIFKFPFRVEILDTDSYNIDVNNEYGEYFFNLKLVGDNEVTLQSNYKIIKEMIPKNKYNLLKKMNQLLQEIRNRRIIVKMKDQ
ncbi:DUF3857 domain-containing protein [Croceitalea vernalis]|uniref:DUF3857 domain-containing protein n=1 Tax=Croceitalea vernalis TaxID=3075599 RepID=A0ABU3BFF3_9FLAO|nr:DUF3857 domain-containing protein [Croceitalea sp. P007]MDT0620874.1 DUF3857 domain-containing protein [Croceitalea sp. P007]